MRLGLALAMTVVAGARAHGGACPSPHVDVLPADGATNVPLNAQVRLVAGGEQVELFELADPKTRRIVASANARVSTLDIALRDDRGKTVPANVRRLPATTLPTLIVQPSADLAPHTRYAVVAHAEDKDLAIAHFTTGDARDSDPPALERATGAGFFRWVASTPPDWKDPSGDFAEVTVVGVTGAAGFEIHADGDALTENTLRVVVPAVSETVRFGSRWECEAPSFVFPDIAQGKRKAPLVLSIRAFDLAGNTSPARSFTIDLARPKLRH